MPMFLKQQFTTGKAALMRSTIDQTLRMTCCSQLVWNETRRLTHYQVDIEHNIEQYKITSNLAICARCKLGNEADVRTLRVLLFDADPE